jgi:hypothetical protein
MMTIPCDARNTLVRNRDRIEGAYNLKMYFPRSEVRGANQGLKLVGGTSSMFEAQKEINRVLYIWRGEYDAFKERQSRRRRMATNDEKKAVNEGGSWPSLPEKASSKVAVGKNPFSALDGLVEETSVVPIVVPKKATLKGWSRVASMAAVPVAVSSTKAVAVSSTKAAVVSSTKAAVVSSTKAVAVSSTKAAVVSSTKAAVVSATDHFPEMTMDELTKSALDAGTIDWGDFVDEEGDW